MRANRATNEDCIIAIFWDIPRLVALILLIVFLAERI